MGGGWFFIQRSYANHFFGAAALGTVLAALEVPRLLLDLLVGFLTVRERDPRVGFAKGTTQPDGKISRHPNFPVIQAYPEPANGRVLARRICVEK